jgi:hypothetical protein
MNGFNISESELKAAKNFFSDSDVEALTAQSLKINKSQPNFTAVVLALEMHGLNRIKVEDLLESIFVVYYAQTELRKRRINQISTGQIKKNAQGFEEFIKYYNVEKEIGSDDLSEIKFIRDNIVLNFALTTLRDLFGDSTKIPKEVVFAYFALLKAIEIGADKGE